MSIAKNEAQKIVNWVADTQFNLIYDSEGQLIPGKDLIEQIRYRAKTYTRFCLNLENLQNVQKYKKLKMK